MNAAHSPQQRGLSVSFRWPWSSLHAPLEFHFTSLPVCFPPWGDSLVLAALQQTWVGSSQAVSRRSQPLLIISHFSTALMRGVTGRLRCFYKVVGWRALRTAVQRNASDALLLASGLLIWSGISSWWKDCTEFPFLTVAEKQKLHYFTKSHSFHSGKECWS